MKILLVRRNLLFVIILMCVQVALYLFLAKREVQLTPPGHIHTMMQVDTYYPDLIRQAKMGRWAVIDDHSTLPAPTVHAYVFFTLAGKVAALFNIDPVAMYELLRVTGAVALFIATYLFITQLLPPSLHLIAIVFTLVIDTGPVWADLIKTSVTRWTAASPTQFIIARNFGLPHHVWGEAMGLMLIYMIFRAVKSPSNTTLVAIILLGFFGTVTLPSYFVIITACLLVPWLLYAIATKTFRRTFPPVVLAVLVIFAAGLWIKYEFDKGPPWDALVAVEKTWWTNRDTYIQFIQSFTLFYPFVAVLLFLIPTGWARWPKQIRRLVFLCASWSFLPLAMIYFSKAPWFPVSNGRIASDVSPVPIGILSTIGVYALWQKIRHIPLMKTVALVLFSLFTAASLFFSVLYFRQSMAAQDQAVYGEAYSWTLYASNDLWNGMMALRAVPPFSHVMINPRIGELITAYLPLRVFQSAPLTFTNWLVRRGQSYLFYTGQLEPNDLRELLRTNDISYVFYGPEERLATKTDTFYPYVLEVMYQNPEVTIFKVKRL